METGKRVTAQPQWRDFVLSKRGCRAGCCHLGGCADETLGKPRKFQSFPDFHQVTVERHHGKTQPGVCGCHFRPRSEHLGKGVQCRGHSVPCSVAMGEQPARGASTARARPMAAPLWENEPVPPSRSRGRCGQPQLGVTLSAVHRAPAQRHLLPHLCRHILPSFLPFPALSAARNSPAGRWRSPRAVGQSWRAPGLLSGRGFDHPFPAQTRGGKDLFKKVVGSQLWNIGQPLSGSCRERG